MTGGVAGFTLEIMSHGSSPTNSRFPTGEPAGWRTDPVTAGLERWWDGVHWGDETRSVDRPIAGGTQQARPRTQLPKPNRTLASISQIVLVLPSLAAIGLAVLNALTWLDQTIHLSPVITLAAMGAMSTGYGLGMLLVLGWFLVRRADVRLNRALMRRSVGASIVGWFVPLLNLVWPKQDLTDLWYAARPELAHATRRVPAPTPGSVSTWWAGMLGSGVVNLAMLAVLRSGTDLRATFGDQTQLVVTAVQVGSVLGPLLIAVSAWGLILTVTQVEEHLRMPDAVPEPYETSTRTHV